MRQMNTRRLVLTLILFAITFLLTWLVSITLHYQNQPTGYWTLGDVGVYISAALLGGPWGALVAGAASALADIVVGQASYALASFVIKAGMALLFAWYMRDGRTVLHIVKGTIYAGALMIFAYFFFDLLIRGNYALAAYGLPINFLQMVASCLIAVPVLFLLGGKRYREGEGFAAVHGAVQSGTVPRAANSRNLK